MNILPIISLINVAAIHIDAGHFLPMGIQSLLGAYVCVGLLFIAFKAYSPPRFLCLSKCQSPCCA